MIRDERGYTEVDHGPCPVCNGTGEIMIEVQMIEMEDLDDENSNA